MITLDLDLSYLCSRYHIASSAMQYYQKQNMSISQIMQTEAKNGNYTASQVMMEMTSNPKELAKLFQLINPNNRYLILSNMNSTDLMMIMQFLDPKEMLLGLSIFNRDVILNMMMELDPEALATVVLTQMEPDKFLKIIPEEFLDEFLTSDKIDRNMIMKALEDVDEEQLQKMMENITGESCYDDRDTILQNMYGLSDDDFMRTLFAAEPEGKQQLISSLLSEKPDLFEEFSAEAMVHPFTTMEKEDVLKSLSVLETKDMLPMVKDLPQDLMALIATQIDPQVFSEILCKDFANVIANCGLKL